MEEMIVNQRIIVRFCLTFVLMIIAGLFNACKLTTLDQNATTNSQTTLTNAPITTTNGQSATTTNDFLLNMPRIDINTNSLDITSFEEYTDCLVTISTGVADYNLNQVQAGIRLRGHSTSNFDKKPYRIRFEEKTQPLGLGSGPSRSWVLLAEYMDISMVRNYITYKLANQLLRNSFNTEAAYVEVYLNGINKGVYLMVEQTQVGLNRVNIDESGVEDPMITDTGFLLELEADASRRNAEGTNMVDWFTVPGYTNTTIEFGWWNMPDYALSNEVGFYIIKSEAKSFAQIQYIQNYMVSVYDAIYVTKTFEAVNALVDIESAVDMYLLQLFTNDMDYNYSSNYIYKDAGGKIIFGPPWDNDLSYGNHYLNKASDSLHIYHLLYQLSTYEWFQTMVIQRWNEINQPTVNLINQTKTLITSTSTLYQAKFSANHNLWENTRRDDGWHGIYVRFSSQALAAAQVSNWIDARIIFMNDLFESWED